MDNRSVPVNTVLPHIVYRNVQEACDWLIRVFGFQEHYRYGEPVSGVQMHLGDAYVMISGPRAGTESPARLGLGTQMLTVIVPDVDAHYAMGVREGARVVEEMNETIYGERQYAALDLDGHRWTFATHVRDVSPAEWGATLA